MEIEITRDLIPATGLLSLMHMLTAGFLKTTKDVTLNSGYYYMAQSEDAVSFVDTIINTIGALVFPLSMSLLFPVFLSNIVLEKEEKLIQMMKMNGMKISNYWLVFFLFNFLMELVTFLLFFLVGVFLVDMPFFTQTSPALLLIITLGWMLSQIGFSVFFQTFLSSSRSANIIGYLVTIWTTMIAGTLSLGVYQYPREFPTFLQLIPLFSFPRLFSLMLTKCSSGDCYTSLEGITDEMKVCIGSLYISALLFFFLGAYLFEIIPQEFGVRQSPLFPFRQIKRAFGKISGKN